MAAIAAVLVAVRVGDGSGGDEAALLTRARQAVEEAGTYRFSLTQGVTGDARGASVTISMTGSVDVAAGRTQLALTTGGGPFSIDCTYITDGSAFYTMVHETRREELGAEWVRSALDRPFGVSGFQFTPEELYRDPQEVFRDLERTGTSEVRGVATTEYSASLDLASLLPVRSPAPSALPQQLPATLSLDGEGRLVRVVFDFGPTPGTAATTANVRFRSTLELFDFGEPIDIQVPPHAKQGSPSEGATACYPAAAPASP